MSGAARSCARDPIPAARRSRGGARSPPRRSSPAARPCATSCATPRTRASSRSRLASPRSSCFRRRNFATRPSRSLRATAPRHGVSAPRKASRVSARPSASDLAAPRDNVLVVAGAQQGLDLLARCLVDPGDAVIVDRPGYLGAIDSFRSAGARLVGWDLASSRRGRARGAAAAVSSQAPLSQPDASESDGRDAAAPVRRDVLELAARYRVPIVEDDTYRELSLAAPPPPSLYSSIRRTTSSFT